MDIERGHALHESVLHLRLTDSVTFFKGADPRCVTSSWERQACAIIPPGRVEALGHVSRLGNVGHSMVFFSIHIPYARLSPQMGQPMLLLHHEPPRGGSAAAGQDGLSLAGAPPMDDATPPSRPIHEELTALRRQVGDLQATQKVAQQIVETVRDPLLVLTPEFRVQSANPAFYHLFQVTPAETEGQHIYTLGNGQWNLPELRTLLEEILPRSTVFNDYAVTHDFARIGPRTILLPTLSSPTQKKFDIVDRPHPQTSAGF
jgi:PAS domain-containing protein